MVNFSVLRTRAQDRAYRIATERRQNHAARQRAQVLTQTAAPPTPTAHHRIPTTTHRRFDVERPVKWPISACCLGVVWGFWL